MRTGGWIGRRIWNGTDPFLLNGILFGLEHSKIKGSEKRICDLIKDLYPSLLISFLSPAWRAFSDAWAAYPKFPNGC